MDQAPMILKMWNPHTKRRLSYKGQLALAVFVWCLLFLVLLLALHWFTAPPCGRSTGTPTQSRMRANLRGVSSRYSSPRRRQKVGTAAKN